MENKPTASAAARQDNSIMKPVDQRARSKGRIDIMTRRLKNRERQRRYRARKRLEAEMKKSSVTTETTSVQAILQSNGKAEPQSNGNHNICMTRIYCKRDWKKDARQAHVCKHQEMTLYESIDPSPTLTSESEASCLAFGNKPEPTMERKILSGSPGVVNNETPKTVLCRRDWKAEARKKRIA